MNHNYYVLRDNEKKNQIRTIEDSNWRNLAARIEYNLNELTIILFKAAAKGINPESLLLTK